MRHNSSRRSKGRNNNNGSNHGGNNNGGNRRGSNVPPRMQVFDSNGPDVRIRGTAWQVHEKYLALAKDAASSGDTSLTENYLQHAEHYQRIINTFTEQMGNWAPPATNTDQAIELDDNQGEAQDQNQNFERSPTVAEAGAEKPQNEGRQRRSRNRRPAESADVENDDDLGLPASMLKPSGVSPEKVAESA